MSNRQLTTATVAGIEPQHSRQVKVGDVVGFKADYEQYGRITEIFTDGRNVYLRLVGNFIGEYIGGKTETVEMASRCWFEG